MRQVDSGSQVCNSVAPYWLLEPRILPKRVSGTLPWLGGGQQERTAVMTKKKKKIETRSRTSEV